MGKRQISTEDLYASSGLQNERNDAVWQMQTYIAIQSLSINQYARAV